jgi:hypothetical protein
VVGVGVKNSTSDLFLNNCDEFIYYDDIVRESPPAHTAPTSRGRARAKAVAHAEPPHEKGPTVEKALQLVTSTLEAIIGERGHDDAIHGSLIKQTIKRRHPGFDERAYGFRLFNDLLQEAQQRGLIKLTSDEKSGGYTVVPAR